MNSDIRPSAILSDPNTALILSAVAQAPFAALLFTPDDALTLLWRNAAHVLMSQSPDLEITGRGMFEAFPPSEDADGAAAMQAIFGAVAEIKTTREAVAIGPYRYDLRNPEGAYQEHHWHMRMSPVIADGEVIAVLQVAQDATQEVLDKRLSETLHRAAASTAGVSFFSYDPETDHFERTATVDELFGFAPQEAGAMAAPFFDRVHKEDLQGIRDEVARVFAAPAGEVAAFDYRVPQADGSERFLRIRAEVAVDPADRRQKLVGTFVDLTDVEGQRLQLQRELELREALVREANHRIKNSLAIALAMLRMERRAISGTGAQDSPAALAALAALEARISAISGAHGLMQLDGDRTDVSLNDLLKASVAQMRATAGLSEVNMQLSVEAVDIRLDSSAATSLGMILNELMINALKYGLNQQGDAEVRVSSTATAEAMIITVTNRIEEKQPIDAISSSKLGSALVGQLAEALGASITAEIDGAYYRVTLRLPR